MTEHISAQGSTALVVGATGGIGRATVGALLRSGRRVIPAGRDGDELARIAADADADHGQLAAPVVIDLADPTATEHALRHLDVGALVIASGVGSSGRPLHGTPADYIETTIETNVSGPLYVVRAVVPGMIERGRGDIVLIGSVAGSYPTGSALYGASKSANHAMAQNLRLELADHDIRVTEVSPGRVRTQLFSKARDGRADDVLRQADGFLEPDDVAEAVMFALDVPRRARVNLLEVVPSLHQLGGSRMHQHTARDDAG